MLYPALAFIAVVVFALTHLWAEKLGKLDKFLQGKLLSLGGGVAIAYVFIDILPRLAKSHYTFQFLFEKHVFVMALAGFMLFYLVDKGPGLVQKKRAMRFSTLCYALFNFLIGYAVVDKSNPEVHPLLLFTFAMALHFLTNDYSLTKSQGEGYVKKGKWLLISCLFLGWLAGVAVTIPPAGIALVSAFIGGGVIMNVTRHELPKEHPHNSKTFLLAAIIYTLILLLLGS